MASLERQGIGPSQPNALENLDSRLYSADLPELRREYENRLSLVKSKVPGTDEHIDAVRMATIAGYYLSWRRVDAGNPEEAKNIIDVLGGLYAPYMASPPPALRMPLARYHWLISHYSWRIGDKAGDGAAKRTAREMVDDVTIYPPDYTALGRMKARILWDLSGTDLEARAKACDLFRAVALLRRTDDRAQYGLASCRITEAKAKLAEGSPIEALALLEVTLQDFQSVGRAQLDQPVHFYMSEVILLNAMSAITQGFSPGISPERYRIKSARRFIDIVSGKVYYQNSLWQARDIYTDFSGMDDADLLSEGGSSNAQASRFAIFSDIASAIEASRKAFPQSPSFAYVALDSRTKAIAALLEQGKAEEALTRSDAAMAVYRESPILARLTNFEGDGEIECSFLKQRVELQLKLGHSGKAEETFDAMARSCGAWARKYPWDFYVRSPFVTASTAIGKMLYDAKRFGEAVPHLTYASNWGDAKASAVLADMYRDGQGVPADEGRSKTLRNLASSQTMKRFTVPTDFSGQKHPFHVYVLQYASGPRCKLQAEPLDPRESCAGYDGIDDQSLWVKQARGGDVPKDVIEAFRKLDTIARENNVSFPELTVYALGAASKPETGATEALAKAIRAEMDKAKFRRNPMRLLDSAGLALSGYDPVSYAQGPKPMVGKAEFFALWDGALWLFGSAQNRDRFVLEPARFAPQFGGHSATGVANGEIKAGDPAIFALVDDKLFLFDSSSGAAEWRERGKALIPQADAKWAGLYPETIDTDSPLALLIAKIAPVARQSRYEVLSEACQANRPNGCSALSANLIALCLNDKSIVACGEAIKFSEAGKLNPQLVSLLGSRSWYYALDNKPDEAIADARRALEIDADQPWIHGNLANGLLMKGEVSQAIDIYKAQKGKRGPDERTTMCAAILGDIEKLLEKKFIAKEVEDRVRRALACG